MGIKVSKHRMLEIIKSPIKTMPNNFCKINATYYIEYKSLLPNVNVCPSNRYFKHVLISFFLLYILFIFPYVCCVLFLIMADWARHRHYVKEIKQTNIILLQIVRVVQYFADSIIYNLCFLL